MRATLILSLLVLLRPAPPAGAEELAALLTRLTEHAEKVKALSQSGVTVSTTMEQLDGKGKVESKSEFVSRRFVRDGSEVSELRRFVKDGKDETSQEKARRAERERKTASGKKETTMSFTVTSPFSAEAVGRHKFSLAGPDPKDPALSRVAFEPRSGPSPDALAGEAGVDTASGTVRWIRYKPTKYPKHVTRMDVVMIYDLEAPGGPALSRVSVDAEGGLLFVRKGFRSDSLFSDYGGGPSR